MPEWKVTHPGAEHLTLAGRASAVAAMLAARRAPRIVAGVALPFWVLCVVLAALLLFVWLFTAHRFRWTHHNLLLFNPLSLLLPLGGWRLVRGLAPVTGFGRRPCVVAALPIVCPSLVQASGR